MSRRRPGEGCAAASRNFTDHHTQPDNLFRGTRTRDGTKVVIKAVHLRSREFAIIQFLSTPPLRDDPMNHCIRGSELRYFRLIFLSCSARCAAVLDLIKVEEEDLGFIVMEQVSRVAVFRDRL